MDALAEKIKTFTVQPGEKLPESEVVIDNLNDPIRTEQIWLKLQEVRRCYHHPNAVVPQ